MAKTFLTIAAIAGFLAVALGAFGAHGLRGRLTPELMSAFETGVQYHFYHTLALLAVAVLMNTNVDAPALNVGGGLFVVGIVLFSGSLYLMALTGTRWLGAITPMGGVAFLAGWLCLAWSAIRSTGN